MNICGVRENCLESAICVEFREKLFPLAPTASWKREITAMNCKMCSWKSPFFAAWKKAAELEPALPGNIPSAAVLTEKLFVCVAFYVQRPHR